MNGRSKSDPEGGWQGPHLDGHTCLDLLYDLVSPEEKERWLSHLAVCPACEKFFQQRARVRERLLATRVLRSLPGGELALERSEEPVSAGDEQARGLWGFLSEAWGRLPEGLRQPRLQLAGAVAVAVTVLLVVFLPYRGAPPTARLYPLPTAFDDTRLRAIAEAPSNEDLVSGLEAYSRDDLESAIDLLAEARVPEQMQVVREIYLGSALALTGEYEEAVNILEPLSLGPLPEEWGREAQWTLYVSLKETGRGASADSLLMLLARKPGEVGQRARLFLQQQEQD